MGARGPKPKDPARRQRRNKRPTLAIVERSAIPRPPDGLLKATREKWVEYWQSDIAGSIGPEESHLVEALFQRIDERFRAYRAIQKQGRVVQGSKGQPVQHPLLKYIDTCDAEIRQLSDRLGLGLRAKAQIGAPADRKKQTLDDLNRALATDDQDPRLKAVK